MAFSLTAFIILKYFNFFSDIQQEISFPLDGLTKAIKLYMC